MPDTWGRTSAVSEARVRPGSVASSCWLCFCSVTTPTSGAALAVAAGAASFLEQAARLAASASAHSTAVPMRRPPAGEAETCTCPAPGWESEGAARRGLGEKGTSKIMGAAKSLGASHDCAVPIFLVCKADGMPPKSPGKSIQDDACVGARRHMQVQCHLDRKSTRLNSSHLVISYAVFCLKKKKILLLSTTVSTTIGVVPTLLLLTLGPRGLLPPVANSTNLLRHHSDRDRIFRTHLRAHRA